MSVTNHPPITVVIAPAFDREGNRRPGMFWALMGNVTFTTSATPFRDAAQYFLGHDVPEETPYTATHVEGGPPVMSATLGSVHGDSAAQLSCRFPPPNYALPATFKEKHGHD